MNTITKAIATTVLALLATGCATQSADTAEAGERVTVQTVAAKVSPAERIAAEPKTLAGYRKMFDRVPVAQFGGGDIGIQTRLADGRRVWLYGDSLSVNNGMVRNAALVQSGKRIHVSQGGAQVLPDSKDAAGRTVVYWPETVREVRPGVLRVVSAPVAMVGTGLFGFERVPSLSRVAKVTVDSKGDLTFRGWQGMVQRPALTQDGEDAHAALDGTVGKWHYWYIVHSDIRLANGSYLMTYSQNFDTLEMGERADGSLRYKMWRNVITSAPTQNVADAHPFL